MLTARAPGKLLVFGEYAVLDGAPALVQAIDRQAQVRLRWHDAAMHQVRALPIAPEPSRFRFDPNGRVHWQSSEGAPALAYVEALLNALGPLPGGADRCLDIELDTRDFFDAGAAHKLGLGSSAALTVALASAWTALAEGQGGSRPGLDRLVELHRGLQDGRGSGVDVAASVAGGLVVYRNGDVASASRIMPPPGLDWMWIWLGKSASTSEFLAGMAHYRSQRADHYRQRIETMTALAEAGVRALSRGDSNGLLAIIDGYGQAMVQLGDSAGLPIWTDDHRRLALWAERLGVAFKPSGAGGGDIALAAGSDVEALAALARQAQSSGYRVLPLAPAETGLQLQWHNASES